MKLSDTDFPREVRERMEQVLLPGDEILWAGTSMPGMKRNFLDAEGLSGGVFILFVSITWCSKTLLVVIAILFTQSVTADKMGFLMFWLPFMLVSWWLMRFWQKLLFGDNARYYAVSSRFLLRYEKNTMKAVPLSDDLIQNLNIRKDGSGDIIIRKKEKTEGLFCLAEADKVAGILQRAAENIPPVPIPPARRDLTHADEQLPVRLRARIRQVLARDDRLLWVGCAEAWLPGRGIYLFAAFMAVYTLATGHALLQSQVLQMSTWVLFAIGWGILLFLFYIRHLENRRFYFLTDQAMGEIYATHTTELYPLAELSLREITITASGVIHLETSRMTWERMARIDTVLPLLLRGWEKKHRTTDLSAASAL